MKIPSWEYLEPPREKTVQEIMDDMASNMAKTLADQIDKDVIGLMTKNFVELGMPPISHNDIDELINWLSKFNKNNLPCFIKGERV